MHSLCELFNGGLQGNFIFWVCAENYELFECSVAKKDLI